MSPKVKSVLGWIAFLVLLHLAAFTSVHFIGNKTLIWLIPFVLGLNIWWIRKDWRDRDKRDRPL